MASNAKRKNISTIIILAIVLLVPGFLYVALNKVGSNTYVKLPVFGEKVLTGKTVRKMGREFPDTLYHQVKPLTLLSAKDSAVSFLGNDTTISVVHVFYAKDKGLSSGMLQGLKPVVERFAHNHKVQFFSISIDTLDTDKELKNIEDRFAKNFADTWHIVGSKRSLLDYVQKNFLVDAMADPNNAQQYVIGHNYILLDSEKRIRGFYDINLKTDVDRLEDEIKVQLVEEARNHPFKIEKK